MPKHTCGGTIVVLLFFVIFFSGFYPGRREVHQIDLYKIYNKIDFADDNFKNLIVGVGVGVWGGGYGYGYGYGWLMPGALAN